MDGPSLSSSLLHPPQKALAAPANLVMQTSHAQTTLTTNLVNLLPDCRYGRKSTVSM
jgi:hypothetical protein